MTADRRPEFGLGNEYKKAALSKSRNPMVDPFGADSLQGTHTPDISHEMGITSGQLSFYEQLHANSLNDKLAANGLAFTFRSQELKAMQPEVCDAFLETLEVHPFNKDFAGVLIKSARGFDAQGKLMEGRFDPIFMTEDGYLRNGGKLIVITDDEGQLPKGDVQGRISIPKEMLEALNKTLSENKRVTLPDELTKTAKGVSVVTDAEIYPPKGPGNEFFWNRGQIYLNLKTSDGNSIVMTFNAVGDNGLQGGINLAMLDDGRYVLVDTVRPLTGAGSKILKEISRGYADVAQANYQKKLKEVGFPDIDPTQLGMELGLKEADIVQVISSHPVRQDWAYENVTSEAKVIRINKEAALKVAPSEAQQAMEEFEGIFPQKLTAKEILEHVIGGGLMVDAFSLSILGSEWLKDGHVRINPRINADKTYVVLESRFMPQTAKEEMVIPSGPVLEKGWVDIAPIHPNTGNARFFYRARYSDQVNTLPEGRKYVKVSIKEAAEIIKNIDLSTPDTAALFSTLLNRGIIEADPQRME